MRVRVGVAVVALVAVLAGCSSSGGSSSDNARRSVGSVMTEAARVGAAAKTFDYSATVTQGGESVTLKAHYSGSDLAGSVVKNGSTINVIVVGTDVYFKSSDAFWQETIGGSAGVAGAKVFHGKWVRSTADSPAFADIASAFKRSAVLPPAPTASDIADARRGKTTTVDGLSAVGITSQGDGSVAYVRRTGTPYLVELTDGSASTIHFSQWNVPYTVAAPPRADVYDFSNFAR